MDDGGEVNLMRIVHVISTAAALVALAVSTPALAQATPPHHPAGHEMDNTVHHFYLYEDGGAMDLSVKEKTDKAGLETVRMHLTEMAKMLGHGTAEMMTAHEAHAMPGLEDLMKMKDKIKYTFVETPVGGRVDIVTTDKAALAAVHGFLKHHIAEHKTGDKTTVMKRK